MSNKRYYLSFIVVLALGFIIGVSLGLLIAQVKIYNVASLKTIGVQVFWNQNQTEPVSQINWGTLEPDTSKTITVYVRSIGNTPITLTIYTEKWKPSNCIEYITLTATPNNIVIEPSEVREVSLTLNVASDIQGITTFSFDIVFNGSG